MIPRVLVFEHFLSQQSVNKYHTIEMKKILFLIFSVFVCLQTLSGRGKVFDYPCDFYPNKKMDRMLKKYGNLYYRISGYSCVVLSQTDSGVKMLKFNNNKVQKKNFYLQYHNVLSILQHHFCNKDCTHKNCNEQSHC